MIEALKPKNLPPAKYHADFVERAMQQPDPKIWEKIGYFAQTAQTDPVSAIQNLEDIFKKNPQALGALLSLLNAYIAENDKEGIENTIRRMEKANAKVGGFLIERFVKIWRNGRIDLSGVDLYLNPAVIEPQILKVIARGGYEQHELAISLAILKPGDRVLELGSGLGFIACGTLKEIPDIVWQGIEANPDLIPISDRNRELNKVSFSVEHAACAPTDSDVTFYLNNRGFWAASLTPDEDTTHSVKVPGRSGQTLIKQYKPNVLICDIEGGEYDVLLNADLSSLDAIVIEFHPSQTDSATHSQALARLLSEGFLFETMLSAGNVNCWCRPERADTQRSW